MLTVNFRRPIVAKRHLHGLSLSVSTGMCYVDVTFPDGTSRVWGYIGEDPPLGSQFAPLAGIDPALYEAIQKEINTQLGDANAPINKVLPPDEEDEDDDDDDAS